MMARGGRNQKPIPIRKQQGNPGRRPIPEVVEAPDVEDLTPPAGLDYHGKQAWERNAPVLQAMGVLKQNHIDALFAYCDAWSQLRRAQIILSQSFKKWKKSLSLDDGDASEIDLFAAYTSIQRSANVDRKAARLDIRMFAQEFGMTPVANAKLVVDSGDKSDPFSDWESSGRRSS